MKKFIVLIAVASSLLVGTSYAQIIDSGHTSVAMRPVDRHTEVEPKMLKNLSDFLVYPPSAMKKRLEGKVYLSALIGKNGKVEKLSVDRFTDSVFIKPATDA